MMQQAQRAECTHSTQLMPLRSGADSSKKSGLRNSYGPRSLAVQRILKPVKSLLKLRQSLAEKFAANGDCSLEMAEEDIREIRGPARTPLIRCSMLIGNQLSMGIDNGG